MIFYCSNLTAWAMWTGSFLNSERHRFCLWWKALRDACSRSEQTHVSSAREQQETNYQPIGHVFTVQKCGHASCFTPLAIRSEVLETHIARPRLTLHTVRSCRNSQLQIAKLSPIKRKTLEVRSRGNAYHGPVKCDPRVSVSGYQLIIYTFGVWVTSFLSAWAQVPIFCSPVHLISTSCHSADVP